jgi:tRNA nucleotidyltransferase (CCA-adding enzyme)
MRRDEISDMHSRQIDEGVTVPVFKQGNLGATLRRRLPRRIVRLLREAGELADRLDLGAYVAGGFVRDLLRGHPNFDLDLVVEGDGLKFARALAEGLQARVKVHKRFGTATVTLSDGFKLDIATARTEWYEYPAALPTVQPSSIREDLYRRDFTINTLAICLNGRSFWELLDLYGGQRDIKERIIRVLHSHSFIDDPTRIFRAIRFELRSGFRISDETLALIRGATRKAMIDRLSGRRLVAELRRLLSECEPRLAICRLAGLGLLRFIHPKLAWSRRLDGVLIVKSRR